LAFVYPSFCEGFGLPLLEAMERGCVCLSTNMGASPEVAGDAALYVNPYAVNEIATGLRRLANLPESERQALQTKARQRAATFTWKRFHDGLATVLRKAATV
jgi:glycosyltransferase involved in cell wall biosynthesis